MNSETSTKNKRRWRKIAAWSLGGLGLLVAGAIVTAVLLIDHSPRVRQRILAAVEKSVAESTGAKLQVRDFRLVPRNLSLDLYGITVHGTESNRCPPLLQADHVHLEVKILSLPHRRRRLQNVVIDHPVLHFFVDKAGENNLPRSSQQSNTMIFDLAIQRLVLDRGEIYYNDKKSMLGAELHDVNVNAGFDHGQSRYYGDVNYRRGVFNMGRTRRWSTILRRTSILRRRVSPSTS